MGAQLIWRTLRDIRFACGYAASAHREKGSTWTWPDPSKRETTDDDFDRDDLREEPEEAPEEDEPDEEADFGG